VKLLPSDIQIILPEKLISRSYVRRDILKLDANIISSGSGVFIKEAHILRRARPGHFFLHEEVHAYRKYFKVSDLDPKPESLIYLSRFGVKSDAYDRTYPSEFIESVISSISGKIIRTVNASDADYAVAADDAETVIADFGSAILNIINWNVKKLIIIYSPDWLDVAPFFLGKSLGVEQVYLIDHTKYNNEELKLKLLAACSFI
jgi:hypothetical protein